MHENGRNVFVALIGMKCYKRGPTEAMRGNKTGLKVCWLSFIQTGKRFISITFLYTSSQSDHYNKAPSHLISPM